MTTSLENKKGFDFGVENESLFKLGGFASVDGTQLYVIYADNEKGDGPYYITGDAFDWLPFYEVMPTGKVIKPYSDQEHGMNDYERGHIKACLEKILAGKHTNV